MKTIQEYALLAMHTAGQMKPQSSIDWEWRDLAVIGKLVDDVETLTKEVERLKALNKA